MEVDINPRDPTKLPRHRHECDDPFRRRKPFFLLQISSLGKRESSEDSVGTFENRGLKLRDEAAQRSRIPGRCITNPLTETSSCGQFCAAVTHS